MGAGYYFWAWVLGGGFLILCTIWAIRTAPVRDGEYSHLDRLDGLGDHEFIHERVNAVGGSAETTTFTIRHHGGAA